MATNRIAAFKTTPGRDYLVYNNYFSIFLNVFLSRIDSFYLKKFGLLKILNYIYISINYQLFNLNTNQK